MGEEGKTGYCLKKSEAAPDCAACTVFSMDDVREDISLADADAEISSFCFRLFHRDMEMRRLWRRKVCKHFSEDATG